MSYQCWTERKDHLLQPAGNAVADASREIHATFVPTTHGWLMVHQPQVLFLQNCFPAGWLPTSLVHGVIPPPLRYPLWHVRSARRYLLFPENQNKHLLGQTEVYLSLPKVSSVTVPHLLQQECSFLTLYFLLAKVYTQNKQENQNDCSFPFLSLKHYSYHCRVRNRPWFLLTRK